MENFSSVCKKRLSTIIVLSMVMQGVFVWGPMPVRAAISNGAEAFRVLGQDPFTATAAIGPTQKEFQADAIPSDYDTENERLFVVDGSANRVLVYDLSGGLHNDLSAASVIGQATFTGNGTGTTATTLDGPRDAIYVHQGASEWLFVADGTNSRVMVYNAADGFTNGEAAIAVLGQEDFVSALQDTDADSLNGVTALAYDATNDRLFVTDAGNSRVLIYDISGGVTTGMDAAYAIGQPDLVTGDSNLTQDGLFGPEDGLAFNSTTEWLYVADTNGNRVLGYDLSGTIASGEDADLVLGQPDFMTGTLGLDNVTFSEPRGVVIDPGTDLLYVSDSNNVRVLVFDAEVGVVADGDAAQNVLGQGDFDSNTTSRIRNFFSNGTTQGSLDTVNDLLFVGEDHRILVFDVASIVNGENAAYVIGENNYQEFASDSNAMGFFGPSDAVFDDTNNFLYVADTSNDRVLVFDTTTVLSGEDAIKVIGQADFTNNNGAASQTRMSNPEGLAYDSVNDRLYVADTGNSRVLIFDDASSLPTTGGAADLVLGQPDFTSFTEDLTINTFHYPRDVEYDAENDRLFVSDSQNNRVMVFNSAQSLTGYDDADFVLGQEDFVTEAFATDADSMGENWGIAYHAGLDYLFVGDQGGDRVMVFNVAVVNDGEDAVRVLGATTLTVSGDVGPDTHTVAVPKGILVESTTNRLFVSDDNRVMVFDLSDGVTNGEDAINVLGQDDFTTNDSITNPATRDGLSYANGLAYDPANDWLMVSEGVNNRVTFFDAAEVGAATNDPTLNNAITASRLKAGASATYNFGFTLQNAITGTLTITFPAGFTVTAAATGGACTGGTVGTFGFTSSTLTAVKTGCTAGALTLTGATVTNHSTPGSYTISWVNDDPGEGEIYIVDDDQVTVTANVDPTLTMNAGSQASATACDGTFSGNGGTVALGALTVGAVASSDASSLNHICTRLSTNASSGAVMTVKSLNGANGLVSTSVPGDTIASPGGATTIVAGTAGYAICAGSAGGDSGNDAISGAASPTRSSPFNGASCTSSGHNVGGLTTSAQSLWSLSGPSQNAFVRVYVKAAISPVTPAHSDYTDTLTFIGTGTF